MGKTKQIKEKKFDRSVEISAPILDPEVIKAIHAPPKDKKLDIRHGGFKALLSDLNSQDSTDELAPITETNHLPSYIGISCAVSGYSNYSSYSKKPLDEIIDTKTSRSNQRNYQLKSSNTPHNNRSYANSSPIGTKHEQQHVNHVTIDKSTIQSPDQERKELTEKLTASRDAERRRSPSPLPPLEDDRHHGAYVGARYFPMPEPSKLVHKHIPLLGIDDDQNPDEFVPEDDNKVEKNIACLYGDEFVEDWKESLSHKSKLVHNEGKEEEETERKNLKLNPKDLVTLKPTPPKAKEPEESKITVDVPTPNVKVLAGVEKQFLNKLLTDENPPTPKSPSPQPMSPVSPKLSPTKAAADGLSPHKIVKRDGVVYRESVDSDSSPVASPVTQELHSPSPPPPTAMVVPEPQPASPVPEPTISKQQSRASPIRTPDHVVESVDDLVRMSPERVVASPVMESSPVHALSQESIVASVKVSHTPEPLTESSVIMSDPADLTMTLDDELNVEMKNSGEILQPIVDQHQQLASISPSSPDSQLSNTTVEEAPAHVEHPEPSDIDGASHTKEEHIEYKIQAQSPVNNESSPVKVLSSDMMNFSGQETASLVSFSPEPLVTAGGVDDNTKLSQENLNNNDNTCEVEESERNDLSKSLAVDRQDLISELPEDEVVAKQVDIVETKTDAVDTKDHDESSEVEIIKDGRYFLGILEQEQSFIREQVELAEARLDAHEAEMDEETIGKVRSAIGKANLLINKKCNQFKELCEKSLVNDANEQYAVLNDDLAGFWDMICIQISDVRKSFENL